MRKLGWLVMALLLAVMAPAAGMAEELGEVDLFDPLIYAVEIQEAPAPDEPIPAGPAQDEATREASAEPVPGEPMPAEHAQEAPVESAQAESPQEQPAQTQSAPVGPAQDEATREAPAEPVPGEPMPAEHAQEAPVESVQNVSPQEQPAQTQPAPVGPAQDEATREASAEPVPGEPMPVESAQEGSDAESAPELPLPEAPVQAEPVSAQPAEAVAAVEAPAAFAVAAPEAFPAELTLGLKQSFALNGAALAGGQPVSYVSSAPKLVSVDESGLILARRRGAATVSCCLGESVLGVCQVTVLKAPGKLTFPGKSVVINAGQLWPFAAQLPKGSAGAVSYASDNPAVVGVDAAGNLYGASGGTATVTATAYNGKHTACTVRVLAGPAPTWLGLSAYQLVLPAKATAQLGAFWDEGCEAVVSYASSDKKIATVSDTGLVTARKAGRATVTVTAHNGLTAVCEVAVFTAPRRVTLNEKKLKMYVNDGYQLVATLPENSLSEITWRSDNPGVATVDEAGLVAAVGVGTATVTAATFNGKTAKCKIVVEAGGGQLPAVEGVRGSVVYSEQTSTLKVTITNDNGVFLAYIWAEDPVRQLFKQYGNGKTADMLQRAVDERGLAGKLVVGFNSSPPVSDFYRPSWNKDPDYRYREPSPLMISNGQVLVNDPTRTIDGKYLYWLDGGNQLCHSEKRLEDMSVEERAALYRRVIDSGARNTMVWQPVLVSDYRATELSPEFLKRKDGNFKKLALGQVDSHNFILVASSDKGWMTFPHMQKYMISLGCKTAVAFDAGGSTSLLWKGVGSDRVEVVTGGSRSLTMVTYFTELG